MRTLGIMVALLVATGCGEPNIEVQCTMNGFGQGSCSFTNTGKAKGAVCGSIAVFKQDGSGVEESSKFCSGEVSPSSTTKVEFAVPEVRTFCDAPAGGSWSDVCAFDFTRAGGS